MDQNGTPNDLDSAFDQNLEDATESTGTTHNPDQLRENNRTSERSVMQTIYDGLTDAKNRVSTAAGIEVNQDAMTAERLADAEAAKREVQQTMNTQFAELSADAQLTKKGLEEEAIARDNELQEVERRQTARSNYDDSLAGGIVDGDFAFGVNEAIVNTNFLADDVVSMRNVEDNSYTHGNQEGSSLPFIEKADQLDSDARGWAEAFSEDFSSAVDSLENFVDAFNLDETKEAYEAATRLYDQTESFEDSIDQIAAEAGTTVEDVNSQIDDSYDGSIDQSGLETLREAQAVLGGQLNDVDNPVGEVDFNPEERENAEEDVRQLRARSLDAAALFKQRLDEARDEIGEVQTEIQETRDEVEEYKQEVEDLTAIEGVGNSIASTLEDMGIETIMDVAARDDFNSNRAYQEVKRSGHANAVPDADELRDAAYETLNDIQAEKDHLDLMPTDTIRDTGDDYSDDDQTRRMFEAVYDSADTMIRVMNELEQEVPDLDQYEMEWDGEAETLEEERSQIYDNLDIDHPSDPRTALEQPDSNDSYVPQV